MKRPRTLLTGLMLALTLSATVARETIGWVEWVRIYPGDISIKAKIDTGAKTSSLGCDCTTTVKRNGEEWVSFSVSNDQGETVRIERKLERIGKIKRHFGDVQKRMVIKLGICLGNTYKETEVNLIDRGGMNYPMLIGRRFLHDTYLIDPGLTFTHMPDCKQAPRQ